MIKLIFTIIVLVLTPTTYFIYKGYRNSITLSNFELAACRLGFNGYKKGNGRISSVEHQEALLKILQMAGYFYPEKVWQCIEALKIDNPIIIFKQLHSVVKKSKANQDNPKEFNAKIFRKNFGKGMVLDEQDMMNFILYSAQNAFGRKVGEERNELLMYDWMKKYQKEYLAAAKVLGLIDREIPTRLNYDCVWIAGASRIGTIARIVDYHYILLKYDIKVSGEIMILTGNRELWANIDGIIPTTRDLLIKVYKTGIDLDTLDISVGPEEDTIRIDEGKEYMLQLAARYNIKLNPLNPFIEYMTREECPPGRFPRRVYPNYADAEGQKLTEALMSYDLVHTYFVDNITTVDTQSDKYLRPTTASTARDIGEKFISNMTNGDFGNKKEFIILFQSNNPYIERQTIVVQREIDILLNKYGLKKESYHVKIEGVGFKNKQDVLNVHSEFAALVSEKWKNAIEVLQKEGIEKKHFIEDLLFQTRANTTTLLPISNTSEIDSDVSGNIFQSFFDEHLP